MSKIITTNWKDTDEELSFNALLELDEDEFVNMNEFQKQVLEHQNEIRRSILDELENYVNYFLESYCPAALFNLIEINKKLKEDNITLNEQQLENNKYKYWITKNGVQIYHEIIIVFAPMEQTKQ